MDILSNWHIWILLAMLLFIVEIFTPGFVLACFGIGALLAGFSSIITDYFEITNAFEVQLLVFAFVCILSYIFIRPIALKYLNKDNGFRSNIDVLIGKRAVVSEDFDTNLMRGRVKIDGDDWRAETEIEQTLNNGDIVEVIRAESNTLIVTKIN